MVPSPRALSKGAKQAGFTVRSRAGIHLGRSRCCRVKWWPLRVGAADRLEHKSLFKYNHKSCCRLQELIAGQTEALTSYLRARQGIFFSATSVLGHYILQAWFLWPYLYLHLDNSVVWHRLSGVYIWRIHCGFLFQIGQLEIKRSVDHENCVNESSGLLDRKSQSNSSSTQYCKNRWFVTMTYLWTQSHLLFQQLFGASSAAEALSCTWFILSTSSSFEEDLVSYPLVGQFSLRKKISQGIVNNFSPTLWCLKWGTPSKCLDYLLVLVFI